MASLTLEFLGTGTSQGVPVIACSCAVCTSSDPRDTRLRSSVLVRVDGKTLLIDAGPDLRAQMLHSEVPGEIQNPQWNNILHQRNVAMPGVQTQDPNTLESDRVREFYNDPR